MKDAYYFPHDSNAHNDPKLMQLRLDLGWEGIGIYWALIEVLREQQNYRFPIDYRLLELRLSTAKAALQAVIEGGFKLGLFDKNETDFWSPSLMRRMETMDLRREAAKKAGSIGGKRSAEVRKQASSDPSNSAQGLLNHKRKEKERKEEEKEKNPEFNSKDTTNSTTTPEQYIQSRSVKRQPTVKELIKNGLIQVVE